MRKYCVYIHRRKDNNLPFYVGCCTRQDNNRLAGVKKFRRAFDFGQRRPRWFEIRRDAGGLNVEIAFTFNDKNDAYQKEFEIVELYGRENFKNGLLVNECHGGIGAPGQINSFKTRHKKSITKLGKLNPMYGRTGENHPTTRKVINLGTGKVFDSITEAADACGYKMKTLYNWLSGHRKNPTDLRFI